MKPGRMDVEFLYDNDTFVGVCLGADSTSEHEWGISGIKNGFGIPDKATRECCGFDARKITIFPDECLRYESEEGVERLQYEWAWHGEFRFRHFPPGKTLNTAWDSSGFVVQSTSGKGELAELFQAFKDLNVVIFLGKSGPFNNGGLKLCIADRLPKEAFKAARESDLDYLNLKAAAAETGILDRLQKAQQSSGHSLFDRKCGYFACSPQWKPDHWDTPTKYDVVFWLNPMQQDANNYGLYTVEELDQWIEGKGPIPKRNQ